MRNSLLGPYDLSVDCINVSLPRNRGGVFALGHLDANGRFRVERVGRDERDLQERLRGLIGSGNQFKFAIAMSPREAFDFECDLFHRLRPPNNVIHPDRSPGTDWKCQRCLQFHL